MVLSVGDESGKVVEVAAGGVEFAVVASAVEGSVVLVDDVLGVLVAVVKLGEGMLGGSVGGAGVAGLGGELFLAGERLVELALELLAALEQRARRSDRRAARPDAAVCR